MIVNFILTASLTISLVLLVLLVLCFKQLWNEKKRRYLTIGQVQEETKKYSAETLKSLDDLFQKRTGLSGALIDVAFNNDTAVEYAAKSINYLQKSVDDLRAILNHTTGQKCSVSIKILQEDDEGNVSVKTWFRDSTSRDKRNEAYDPSEPFPINKHTALAFLHSKNNGRKFWYLNDILEKKGHDPRNGITYQNPNKHWRSFLNSSAIHVISDPDSEDGESVLGFLCADTNSGRFEPNETQYIMSIVATAAYYCIYATSALEYLLDEPIEND